MLPAAIGPPTVLLIWVLTTFAEILMLAIKSGDGVCLIIAFGADDSF